MPHALVLGGTGFVGRHVCEHLVRAGWRVTVLTRHARQAHSVQTLPGVTVLEGDVHRHATLLRHLPGHDAVVHLIGILHGTARDFEAAHTTLTRTLAQAMQDSGVRRLVYVSALGADPNGPSHYQRSKAAAEQVLADSDLDWTVLRPSVVFGAGDSFLSLFARLQAAVPLLLLPGGQTRMQPVWVGDLARAVVVALGQTQTVGRIYELAGPQVYRLAELVSLAGRLSGHPRPVWSLPRCWGYLQAALLRCLPGPPLLSADNVSSLKVDNVAKGALPGLDALGIRATPLPATVASYLDLAGAADPALALRQQHRP